MPDRKRRFDWSHLRPPAPRPPASPSRMGLSAGERGDAPPSRDVIGDDQVDAAAMPLRVNDLKQYAYCPRIVFYQYAMPVAKKATFKMERGKAVEVRVEHLEHRRALREYGLDRGQRRFQVWLSSRRYALSGRLDLLIETPEALYPVDFKDTREPVRYNHHVQLCAYALLVEDCLGGNVPAGFIYRAPRNDVTAVPITAALREATRRYISEIRAMIQAEHMPPLTAVRARCTDCEYRNYCGDVF